MESEESPRKNYGMKPREFERVNVPVRTSGQSAEHDVHALLRQNRATEQRLGINEIEIRPVTSRRKRDFWVLFLIGNASCAVAAFLGRDNPVVFTAATAVMALFSLGLTWIMWFVMGNY
jgi:predicted phage tail protein